MTMGLPRPRNRYMFGNAQKKLGKSAGGSFGCHSSSKMCGGETQCPKSMPGCHASSRGEVSARHTVPGVQPTCCGPAVQ
jgi:hypothetical protein